MTQPVAPDVQATTALAVHGVVRAGTAADLALGNLTERRGRGPLLVPHRGIAAVALRLDGPSNAREELLTHSDLLNQLVMRIPVVPTGFGMTFPDEPAIVEALLMPHYQFLESQLERLGDCCQYTVRATYRQDELLAGLVRADPRVARLREQTRRLPKEAGYRHRVQLGELVSQGVEHARRRDTAHLVAQFRPFCTDLVVSERHGLDRLADLSLLVERSRQDQLVERAEQVAERWHTRATFRLLGPMAAFDFTDSSGART